jgi:hypothetical protein
LRLAVLLGDLDDPLDLPRNVRGRVPDRPMRLGLALAAIALTSTPVKPASAICRATMSFPANDSSKPQRDFGPIAFALVHGESSHARRAST